MLRARVLAAKAVAVTKAVAAAKAGLPQATGRHDGRPLAQLMRWPDNMPRHLPLRLHRWSCRGTVPGDCQHVDGDVGPLRALAAHQQHQRGQQRAERGRQRRDCRRCRCQQ